jgi:transposase
VKAPHALALAVAQDSDHSELAIVVEDRLRHAAEEGEGRDMTVQEGLGGLRRIGFDKAGIGLGQTKAEEMDLALHPADDRERLAKVDLGMAGRTQERHEHLAGPDPVLDGDHICRQVASCVVAFEACCGAHQLGRLLATQGHEVRLMPPKHVRPCVKAQKNDDRDAEAMAAAATRPTMRFVTLKSEQQLDIQTLPRVRAWLVAERTSIMNQIRSLLLERGHVVPQGRTKLATRLADLRDATEQLLSPRICMLIEDMRTRWQALDERIAAFDREFADLAAGDAQARRLITIPGIGALNATALVAAIGDARIFARGRDLAAWLGLFPRQAATGGKPRLLGITKRGSRYLRKLLIQGARAAMPTLSKSDTRIGAWLRGLLARAHANTAVAALAAKMARIAWALLRHERTYQAAAKGAA